MKYRCWITNLRNQSKKSFRYYGIYSNSEINEFLSLVSSQISISRLKDGFQRMNDLWSRNSVFWNECMNLMHWVHIIVLLFIWIFNLFSKTTTNIHYFKWLTCRILSFLYIQIATEWYSVLIVNDNENESYWRCFD